MHPSAAHFASRWRIRLGKRVLFAIDEMPTVGLPNLTGYRATVGHAGITLVMYAEVMSLPEGNLVVFSRGLRLIVQDSAMLSLAGCRECPRPQSWSCRT